MSTANFPDRFIRRRNLQAHIEPVASTLDRKDSTFKHGAGLANGSFESFESINFPGWFLVVEGDKVVLRERKPQDGNFDSNSTFIVLQGQSDPAGKSLESLAQRGKFVRHSQFSLFVHSPDGSELVKKDATFFEVDGHYGDANCGE